MLAGASHSLDYTIAVLNGRVPKRWPPQHRLSKYLQQTNIFGIIGYGYAEAEPYPEGNDNMNEMPRASCPRNFDEADIDAVKGKTLSMKTDASIERLAVLFVVNCFRNTVLETYHTDGVPVTDERMKMLMTEAVNKLNTALHAIFTGEQATQDAAWEALNVYYPQMWDKPEFDQGLLHAIELTKRAREKAKKREH
jgi:hypothetical protein